MLLPLFTTIKTVSMIPNANVRSGQFDGLVPRVKYDDAYDVDGDDGDDGSEGMGWVVIVMGLMIV